MGRTGGDADPVTAEFDSVRVFVTEEVDTRDVVKMVP
jgi:hypothetical protein